MRVSPLVFDWENYASLFLFVFALAELIMLLARGVGWGWGSLPLVGAEGSRTNLVELCARP